MKTVPVRLPSHVVAEASVFGARRTVGESLAIAFGEYLDRHAAELDRLEAQARTKRKAMARRHRPLPDGGGMHA